MIIDVTKLDLSISGTDIKKETGKEAIAEEDFSFDQEDMNNKESTGTPTSGISTPETSSLKEVIPKESVKKQDATSDEEQMKIKVDNVEVSSLSNESLVSNRIGRKLNIAGWESFLTGSHRCWR